jgi:Na+/H+ antiporter NhaA
MPHIPAHTRRWIYTICLAAVPLLVALGILEDQLAPLVIALVGAVVAPGLALANITPEDPAAEDHWAADAAADEAEIEDHRE